MPYADIEKRRMYAREYRLRNLQKRADYQRSHRAKNPKKVQSWQNRWRNENREHFNKVQSENVRRNPEKRRQRQRANYRRRIVSDLNFKIRNRLRTRICLALASQSTTKSTASTKLLGCSIPDFRIYIESLFQSGMSWENYGSGEESWHLDHIIPCALFDLTRHEHQKRCFHFSNYQPMWAIDNLKKGSRSTTDQFNLL